MPFSVTESTFLFCIGTVMSSVVITNAYYQKQQFYPSVVYITKSSASMGIIYLQGLIFVVLIGKLIGKIFFGQLRTAEIEHLIERSWYAVTETCLAFTVFRDDLSPKFVALFTLLLFLKCFHWLAEDRVDYMERSPNISMFFHIRVISLLSILGILDIMFVYLAYYSTLSKGASVQLVFGFEYAILFAIILNISMKYILHFFDLYNENPWEDKAIYLLYTELIMGFLKISLYFIFIFIMMKIHTFPLFAIRPMYLAIRGFKKAFNDVIMSRRAIRNMNAFYPDATAQDIENSDNVCIICRENMLGNGTCKKLPCNHIFHISCLRSWFQRQQTCPTCRMDILHVNSTSSTTSAVNNNNNLNNVNNPNANNNVNQNNMVNGQLPVPPLPPFLATNPLLFQQLQQLIQRQQLLNNNNLNTSTNSNPSNNQEPSSNTNTGNGTTNNNQNNAANFGNFTNVSSLATSSGSSIPATIFPFLQSPPFVMPQIPVETLLQGFSDEELRYLEGQKREQLEARIKCLMDVKTLVTAATIRLQQYNCVVINCKNNNSVSTQTDSLEKESNSNSSPAAVNDNDDQKLQTSDALLLDGNGGSAGGGGDDDNDDNSNSQEVIRHVRIPLQQFSNQNSAPIVGDPQQTQPSSSS